MLCVCVVNVMDIMFMFACVTLLVTCWFIFHLIHNYFISD